MQSQVAPVHRFSLDDIAGMVAAGILDERARVELVDGVLVEMSPIGPRHSIVLEWLTMHFVKASGAAWTVRIQDTLRTPDGGFMQPDLMVFEPVPRDRQPDTALLVIEVSDSSRARDTEKATTYAAAGVLEYWIVDVDSDEVLVHRLPGAEAYGRVERFVSGDIIPAPVEAPPVDVGALLAR